nr:unnamed protein product [Callosobruchus analis]
MSFRSDGIYPARGCEHSLLLARFGIESLQVRRVLSSVIFLYRILHNSIDSPLLLSYICFHVPQFNTRQNVTFYSGNARTNVMRRSPVNVMSSNYNEYFSLYDINQVSLRFLINSLGLINL